MLYNFDALGDSSDDSDGAIAASHPSGPDWTQAEIKRLEAVRDQKRKELLALTKPASSDDAEHQSQLKELSKQIMKLSRASEAERKIAADCEQKLKSLTPSSQPLPTAKVTATDVQSEAIKTLRVQNMILKTDIQKAKRALALEGGCKNRARQIKKLRAQLEDLPPAPTPQIAADPPTKAGPPIDLQTLRSEVAELSRDREALKLTLKGILSRVSTLERSDLKERVKAGLETSAANDAAIEALKPKVKAKPKARAFRGHVGQQSRLSVIILALNSELVTRNRELNHSAVPPNEAGLQIEVERLQKRLHLLESSLSCYM
jgi:hypothetical protein